MARTLWKGAISFGLVHIPVGLYSAEKRNSFDYVPSDSVPNAFDDSRGYRCPLGSHIRRMNPRDAEIAGVARIHRMIRRGTSYGPPLPDGVVEDDGVDRGLMFAFVGAHLGRQFEFVQSEWMNNSEFFGGRASKDPVAGANGEDAGFDIPRRPLPLRLKNLPRFVVTRGGEYAFLPGIRALRWIADEA